MNATETTRKTSNAAKPSNRRANKATREGQTQAASPDEIQAEARQHTQPKKARSRTRAGGKKHRPPAKKDRLVELLRRENGATIEELMTEFGWQAHTLMKSLEPRQVVRPIASDDRILTRERRITGTVAPSAGPGRHQPSGRMSSNSSRSRTLL